MKLYVNFAFLENLLLAEEQTDRHFYIRKLLSSPQPGVELVIDVDAEAMYQNPEKRAIFRQIAQRLPVTDTTFLSACQAKQFHESGESKLFFVDDVPLDISQRFGCFHASSSCLELADFLFYAEEIRIDKQQRDWSSLKNVKHPCNALVVTDNYLFSDKDTYLENIKSICENLMPAALTTGFKFDVTLIGHNPNKDFQPVQDQHKILADYFKNQFTYPVNLTIVRETYHDRYIFTNYCRITSGNGFALFKGRQLLPGKRTTVHCKSLALEGRLSSTYQTRNEELKECSAINRRNGQASGRMAGDGLNRLLQ